MRRALFVALAALSTAAAGQDALPHPWELRLEGGRESLDRGLPDWSEMLAQLKYRPTARATALAGYRSTERFGQRDREGFAGAYLPIPLGGAQLHLEGAWSSTQRVLARRSTLAEIILPFASAWVASVGGNASSYTAGDARAAWAGIEKYHGDMRYAYQARVSRPDGAGWAPSHRLAVSWYRGELSFATLSASRGRETENLFPAGLLQADVRAASLSAGIEIAPRWGLVAEVGWARQGEFYTRRSARLGTRILF
jgi:YaiO family outer membrane protein